MKTRNRLVAAVIATLAAAQLAACGSPELQPPVEEGPSLLASVPANGATGVAPVAGLSLQFSAAIEAASLKVTVAPEVALGAVELSADGTEARFPQAAWAAGARYLVTVAAADAAGRALSGSGAIEFSTAAMLDTTAPGLVSSSPADGALNVAPGTAVVLTFSEAMDPSSLAVTAEPVADLGAATWSAGGTVATFAAPAAALEAKTAYVLTVSAADVAGNPLNDSITFTTAEPPDVTPPTVLVMGPADGAMAVPTNAALSLTFSEPMDRASVDAALTITPAIAGTVLWDDTGSLRSLQPSAPLTASTVYTVKLTTSARDLAGNQVETSYTASFTTAAAADTVKPTIVASSPAAGEKGVRHIANIEVTFSEPMDKAATQAAFSVTAPAGITGAFSWSADGTTMTFDPGSNLPYGEPIAWRVTTLARDLAGNTLASTVSRGFIVIRRTWAVLDATPALDGHVNSVDGVSYLASTFLVGDSSNNLTYRGFFSFDLSGLPEDTRAITYAYVYAYVSATSGSPVALLDGAPLLEHVSYGAPFGAAAYDAEPLQHTTSVQNMMSTVSPGWKGNGAMISANDAWTNRAAQGKRLQFRIRFPKDLAANGQADSVTFHSGDTQAASCPRVNAYAPASSSCRPHLVLAYEHP